MVDAKGSGDPAFDALVTLTDPWLLGREQELRRRLIALSPLDWSAVLATAERHRVTPLLAEHVKAVGIEGDSCLALPETCALTLHRRAREALALELAAFAELRRLTGLLGSNGIAFLVFKGLALSQLCFGKLGVRVNRDIDILIAPESLDRADALLAASGYRRVEPAEDADHTEIEQAKQRVKDWVYVHEARSTILEVHYRLFDNPWLCDREILSRSRTITLFGQLDVPTLSVEDELPYLALHGAMHAWSRLKWLLDFAILLRDRPPSEIADALRQAKAGPEACAMHQAVSLTWRLFSPRTPEPRENRPWRTRIIANAAMHTLSAYGAREIEDTGFGTTLKSASHYFLWSKPRYLAAEFRFDITYHSDDKPRYGLPFWLWRPLSWIGRHLRRRQT